MPGVNLFYMYFLIQSNNINPILYISKPAKTDVLAKIIQLVNNRTEILTLICLTLVIHRCMKIIMQLIFTLNLTFENVSLLFSSTAMTDITIHPRALYVF